MGVLVSVADKGLGAIADSRCSDVGSGVFLTPSTLSAQRADFSKLGVREIEDLKGG